MQFPSFDDVLVAARDHPVMIGSQFSARWDSAFIHLMSICFYLAQNNGGEFCLSCREAGKAVDVSRITAGQLLRRGEKLGFLSAERDRAGRLAGRYRFNVEALPQLGGEVM